MSDRARQRHAALPKVLRLIRFDPPCSCGAIFGRAGFLQRFGVGPAVRYLVVDGRHEFDALALLVGARHLAGMPVAAAYRGDRHNVADPLRSLGFFVEAVGQGGREPPVDIGAFDFATWLGRFDGETDASALVRQRREQSVLRATLGLMDDRPGQCGLCGRHLPSDLLVAAHIKPRGACSPVEQVDAPWIVMPACRLGCDSLCELGYLGVSESGVLVAPADCPIAVVVDEPVPAWCDERKAYFAWHRRHRLRG